MLLWLCTMRYGSDQIFDIYREFPVMLQGAVCFVLGAFLAGSIPFGWLIARTRGIDLRTVGSGSIDSTNAWRALGWKWGLAVMLLDALKGLLPVALRPSLDYRQLLTLRIIPEFMPGPGFEQAVADWGARRAAELHLIQAYAPFVMVIGLAAILGHTFTPWLKFKGGKGVATGLGVVIGLFQWWTLIPLAVFGVTLGLSRIVSASSILAALSLVAMSLLWPYFHAADSYNNMPSLSPYWPFALLIALLVLWTHHGNIRRIVAGTEPRIGQGKAPSA